jgi:hypothetical protein
MKIRQKGKTFDIDDSKLINYDLKHLLKDIYQNSSEIASVEMQPGTGDKYISYGCRVTGLYRCLMYVLKYIYNIDPVDFSLVDFDNLIDKNSGWVDLDIVSVNKILPILQKKFNVNIQYSCKSQDSTINTRIKIQHEILMDVPITIKMPSLVNDHSHFINAVGCKYDNKNLYLKMHETYKNYNGYENFYINWDYVQCFEYFY